MQISWKILNLKRQPRTCITILPSMHITSSKMTTGGYDKITISDWSLKPKKPTYLMFFWAALFLLTPKTIADWEYWNKLLPDFTSMISLPSSVYSFFTLQTTLFNLQTPYAHKLIPKQVSSLSFFLPVHLPRLSCAPVTGNHSGLQMLPGPHASCLSLAFPLSGEIPVFLQCANKSSLGTL